MKLTFKVILSFILLIILVSTANTFSTSYVLKSLQEERLKTTEVFFAKSISKRIFRAVIDEKINRITDLLFEEKSLREEKIKYIIVFDKKGYLLAHTYLGNMPKILIKTHDVFLDQEEYILKNIESDELSVYDIAVPVMEGIKVVGAVHVGIRADYVHNIITPTKTASNLSLIITLFIIAIATMIAIPISQTITNPLRKLKILAEKISKGEMETQIDIRSKDEIGDLANAFNKMTTNLDKTITSLDQEIIERKKAGDELKKAHMEIEEWSLELEKKFREKTDELQTTYVQLFHAEKLSSLGQMAAGISHELNSPLTGLISMIKNFRDNARKGSEEYRHLSLMFEACEHMSQIINDFNSFSRKPASEHMEFDLIETIESSLILIMNQLKLKNIHVTKEYADERHIVKGNKTELQQVVLNIIRNAINSMSYNGMLIINEDITPDKRTIGIKFIDNGCGIKKEDLEKIFDPFVTLTPQGKGIGLGLSISYAIIKNHRGEIKVESEIGQGTTFTILLPAVQS